MREAGKCYIGCSGFYYPSWKGKFYPEGLSSYRWIEYYAGIFNTLELNSTFYRQPKPADLKRYYRVTPPGFRFSVKMSRYITHVKKLADTYGEIMRFTDLLGDSLGEKLGRILFQMPPGFRFSESNLEDVLKNISGDSFNVIEFRDESWWNQPEVETELTKAGITFCNVDFPGKLTPFINTSKVCYLRLHGVPELFKSSYSEESLAKFIDMIPTDVEYLHVYFNNTYYTAGPENALSFIKLLSSRIKVGNMFYT